MGDYRSLRAWQQAHQLVMEVYRLTHDFPPPERYGLTAQMRSAAVSVPAYLAEGTGRHSDRELARFARISLGSAAELDYYILLARELNLVSDDTNRALSRQVGKVRALITALVKAL